MRRKPNIEPHETAKHYSSSIREEAVLLSTYTPMMENGLGPPIFLPDNGLRYRDWQVHGRDEKEQSRTTHSKTEQRAFAPLGIEYSYRANLYRINNILIPTYPHSR